MTSPWDVIDRRLEKFRETNPKDRLVLTLNYQEGLGLLDNTDMFSVRHTTLSNLLQGGIKQMFYRGIFLKLKQESIKGVEQSLT